MSMRWAIAAVLALVLATPTQCLCAPQATSNQTHQHDCCEEEAPVDQKHGSDSCCFSNCLLGEMKTKEAVASVLSTDQEQLAPEFTISLLSTHDFGVDKVVSAYQFGPPRNFWDSPTALLKRLQRWLI